MCMRYFVPNVFCFHFVYNEHIQLLSSCAILAVDEHSTENVRSAHNKIIVIEHIW